MSKENVKKNQYEYKAEMKQLLNLIVHSLYTHPEVFLRELVSNSSDALNKLRVKQLTDQNILNPEQELKITISADKETGEFSIEDTGIGMTQEDLLNQLGTVASSGTLKFLEELKKNETKIDGNMIGKFGVGFYSVFMVTDEVTVETRFAEINSKAYKWTSKGESTFEIEESNKETRGTRISFKLKDEYKDFAQEWKVESILQKYSNFVDFPVYFGEKKVNSVNAIWQRSKENISDEELNEFYKFISNDYQNPLSYLHLNIEGNVNFKSLLFLPETAPPSLFSDVREKSIQLYSSKVFINDDAKDLIPEYLRFVKGVVDTDELPLNVSREVTQSSPVMSKIKQILTKRILGWLEEMAEKESDKYMKFWKNFSSLFKTGVNSDFANKDRIIELLRFESSKSESDEMISLNKYVSRLKENQSEIYYISGNSIDQIVKNPNLEYFKDREIEVLYLTDPVDIFTIPYIEEYDGKKIISIEKADINIDKTKNEESLEGENAKSIIEKFKNVLGGKVQEVRESNRLINSVATLVVSSEGMDPQMEKMMQMMDRNYTGSKRILEINLSHALIKNLSELDDSQSDLIEKTILQIFDGALLIEGKLTNPAEFVSRMNEFMTQATISQAK